MGLSSHLRSEVNSQRFLLNPRQPTAVNHAFHPTAHPVTSSRPCPTIKFFCCCIKQQKFPQYCSQPSSALRISQYRFNLGIRSPNAASNYSFIGDGLQIFPLTPQQPWSNPKDFEQQPDRLVFDRITLFQPPSRFCKRYLFKGLHQQRRTPHSGPTWLSIALRRTRRGSSPSSIQTCTS